MATDNLWGLFAKGDQAARERLLTENLNLVHHVARQLSKALAAPADFDELVSCGTIGLMNALDAFEPQRGLAFSTFAVPRIRGAILDELRRQDHVPRSIRRKTREIAHARETLTRIFGRQATDREVAEHLGLDLLGHDNAVLNLRLQLGVLGRFQDAIGIVDGNAAAGVLDDLVLFGLHLAECGLERRTIELRAGCHQVLGHRDRLAVEVEPRQDVHRRRLVVLRHLAGGDQIRHRREDMRAVDAIAFRAEHEVVASSAPGSLLLHFHVGHAVFRKHAFLLGHEKRRGIRQRDKAELCTFHFGPGALRERAGGKVEFGCGEQSGSTAGCLQDLAAADAAGGRSAGLRHVCGRPLLISGRPFGDARARGRVLRRPQNGGDTIRMMGLEGRLQWRQQPLFKWCANLAAAQ